MKKILQIARLELSILFYSPVAWLVMIVFTIQAALSFTELLAEREASQQLGNTLSSLTQNLFSGSRGFFASVQNKFYLYIPLLTMGLLSREFQSGSIKLLQSSPVTTAQIVWGKYLSMLLYGAILIIILILILGMAALSIENLDYGYLAGALFGLYLLLAAYSAIGLFMSSLTSYQVVAAISTLALLAGLSYIGQIGRGIEVLRDITYWLSMEGRTGNALRGLISTKDVVYFVLVIFLFLSLTTMKLNAGRIIRSPFSKALRYFILIGGVIGVGYISSLPVMTKYLDTTRFQTKTMTPQSQDIIARIDKPVQLTTYANLLGNIAHIGAPKFRNFERSQFEQINRYLPQLKMDYVYYFEESPVGRYDKTLGKEEASKRAATALGYDYEKVLNPDELRKIIDLSGEDYRYVRFLKYEGKTTPLRMFDDQEAYPAEAEIMAAFKRLISAPAKVGILNRNEERSTIRSGDKDYSRLTTSLGSRYAWINQGADIQDIAIGDPVFHPDSLAVLIIADPLLAYTDEQVGAIRHYIDQGGNLLLAGEPNRQRQLNKISEGFGVRFLEGTLLQQTKELELDLIQAGMVKGLDELGFTPTKDTIITMSGAVGLSFRDTLGFRATSVLQTSNKSVWQKFGPFNLKTETVVFDSSEDQEKQFTVAVALTRKIRTDRIQKIWVSGDADFLSNAELSRFNLKNGNYELANQLLRWYSDGEYPVDTQRPSSIDNRITVNKDQIDTIKTGLAMVLPAIFAFAGAWIIIRRKRK